MSDFDVLVPLVKGVLADGTPRSVKVLAEEIKLEYPREFEQFVEAFTTHYELKGCGRMRGHINAIADLLGHLETKGEVASSTVDNEVRWHKK